MRETPTSIILTLRRHYNAEIEINWNNIKQISAFKQDLFNPQIIVLEITCLETSWEVAADDCNGFAIFTHVLASHLTGVIPYERWWPAVTNPLGRQDVVTIYQRADTNATHH